MQINREESIIAFLADNRASSFSRLLYNVPKLYAALQSPRLSMILAPSDEALQRLVNTSKKSLAELQLDTYGIDIFSNHVSTVPTKKEWPMFTAINRNRYGRSVEDITALKLRKTTIIDRVVILVIDMVILFDDQLAKAALQRGLDPLEILRYSDLLMVLIEKGQLRGKDLISLCVSNPVLNKLCDSKLDFKRLLWRDYRLEAPANINPREYYVRIAAGHLAWTTLYSKFDNRDRLQRTINPQLIAPVSINRGFVEVSTGADFTALLDDDGDVFILGTLSVWQHDQLLIRLIATNYEPERVSLGSQRRIIAIRAGSSQVVMLDHQNQLWLYGELTKVKFYNQHYMVDLDRLRNNEVLPEGILNGSLLEENFDLMLYDTPRLIERQYPQATIFDFQVDRAQANLEGGIEITLVVIIENLKPKGFDEPGAPFVSIRSISRINLFVQFIIDSANTTFLAYYLNLQAVVNVNAILQQELPFTGDDIVKIDTCILDKYGRIWTYDDAARYSQVQYDREPDLIFIDVVDDSLGFIWILAADGRLFTLTYIVGDNNPFAGTLELYLFKDPIVAMSFYSGLEMNIAFLTQRHK